MRISLRRFLLPFHSYLRRLRHSSRPVHGVAIGVLCALFVQGLMALGWLSGLDRGALDALFRLRGERAGAPEIVVVLADDATVAHYSAWPLPRRIHADLVRVLHRAGARTVAIDLLFSTPTTQAGDAEFARACREAGNVVQSVVFHLSHPRFLTGQGESLPVSENAIAGEPPARFALEKVDANDEDAAAIMPSAVWLSAPLPSLMQASPAIGHVNVHPEKDGALRRIPHVVDYRGQLYPSLALAAATHFLGLRPADVRVADNEIRLGQRRLPIDAEGETGINWTGGYRNLPTYSMVQVLAGEVPQEAFRDKIVFIGATAAGSFEWRATSFSTAQPAVELQANAVDNILLNRPLRDAPAWLRFLLMLGFSVLMGALVAPRLDLSATLWLLGASSVLWIVALIIIDRSGLYLPIAPAIFAGALAYSLAMAINYREEWEANWRADASVAALARGGALMMSGRDRDQLLEVIRSTAREALQAREVHLLLDGTGTRELPALEPIQKFVMARGRVAMQPPDREEAGTDFGANVLAPNDRTWIAAPILSSKNHLATSGQAPVGRPARGALIALGHLDGRNFTRRDATLLETLADQAALALETLDYYELLQSRVALANRDLREAYGVLSSQTAKFMAAVESMDEAFIICDTGHRAVFVNVVAHAILRGATPELSECVPEKLQRHGLREIAELFEESMPAGEGMRREFAVDERVLAVQLTALNESDSQRSERTGTMLVVADVTMRHELDQMKTDFVGFVAHELRSPLGTILGYASLLQESAASAHTLDALQTEALAAIERQCRRLNRLVNDLLDVSRLDAGRALELRLSDVDMIALCSRVLEAQTATLSDAHLKLSLHCDLPELNALVDPDRMEQILINLLSNAIKYSPGGGEVIVSLSKNQSEVEIAISDQGMGMSQEQVQQLFQKFYRAPDAKERGIKGTGLGLFLVKQLVQAHGGTIHVQSELGHGTTFVVRLPAHRKNAALAVAE